MSRASVRRIDLSNCARNSATLWRMTNFRFYSRPLWKCFHGHFDRFMAAYPRDYQSRYGMLRGVIPEVVDKFMQCGDFAKVTFPGTSDHIV